MLRPALSFPCAIPPRPGRWVAVLSIALLAGACEARREPGPAILAAGRPLHLEEHVASARIEGSAVPADLPAAVEWSFDRERPEWKPVVPLFPGSGPAGVTYTDGALRCTLNQATTQGSSYGRIFRGGVYVDLPDWNWQDWAYIVVRARTAGPIMLTTYFNRRERPGELFFEYEPFLYRGEAVRLINDGKVHNYLIRADWSNWGVTGSWKQLGFFVSSPVPTSFDLLSVSVIPKEALYAKERAGVVTEPREELYRRSLYLHAPGRIDYQVEVPEAGRLDFSLGVLRDDVPVTFRVTVAAEGRRRVVFEEASSRRKQWGQRSVDLAPWAGRRITLGLAAASARAGTVALWGSPTLSGRRRADGPPNVILYVMDAAGAEYISAYGYHRRTTPNLERLAALGALFERAYSNSTWSKPSTASFMTSLQHSVLGGYATPADPLPEKAETMAQLLHAAGFQTGVFTSNTWCGIMSSLERGVDTLRETVVGNNATSSREVQESFWRWREAYPGEPYWVHFQTTDVHWPWEAVPPIAGVFLSRAGRAALHDMERRLGEAEGGIGRSWALRASSELFDKAGVDRQAYFDAVRGAYDEALAHNDLQLGRLVERLKAQGEWEHTLLIVTADHGDWPGLGWFDVWNPEARVPYLNPFITRVPLVVVWPERIQPGQRFREPVSLLDLLPTVLELTGQPRPGHLQGQSLAPLLLGRPGWQPRPVILDEFNADPKTGKLTGAIEIVDGRWGASLAVGEETIAGGPPLLLYDLWEDPYCLRSLHAERPKLAAGYKSRLERQLREHLALGKRFTRSDDGMLGNEQLEALRSLGYIQ